MRRRRKWLIGSGALALGLGAVFASLEPRALVWLTVEGADGVPAAWTFGPGTLPATAATTPSDEVWLALVEDVDSPVAWRPELVQHFGWPIHRTLVVLPSDTSPVFVAFSPSRGLVEEVLGPGSRTGGWSVRLVTLRLPAARPLGTVTIDVSPPGGADGSPRPRRGAHLWLQAPRSGVALARLETREAATPSLALAAGAYELRAVARRNVSICGSHPPLERPFVDGLVPFDVRPGEITAVHHSFEPGGRIVLKPTLASSGMDLFQNGWRMAGLFDAHVDDEAFASESAWRKAAARARLESDGVDVLLHVTASLEPVAGGRPIAPHFKCLGRARPHGRRLAPLGNVSTMLEQGPPGDYVLTLAGPCVEPWSGRVTLQRGVATEVAVALEPRGTR